MSSEQRRQLRKYSIALIPCWRRSIIGYLITIPLIGLIAYGLNFLHHTWGTSFYFPGTLIILLVLFIALFWGVGPALFALFLGTLALDYLFVVPIGHLGIDVDQIGVQLLSFIIAGLIISIIIGQRERAYLSALAAERELQFYTQRLEESNQQLEDANQAKDRFISIASHELKTPITTICGHAQLTLRRLSKQQYSPSESESIRASLEKINDQSHHLALLIDDLFDVSSMRTAKIELYKGTCNLTNVCREVVEDQRLLTERQITLDMPSTPITIEGDEDRLSQVMVNLLSNAAKYSPDSRAIEVRISQHEQQALISVGDYGKGIAKDQLEHIFESFYRTPEAEASSKRGLGLGLAISKDLVERHGGRIWCESEKGKGSSFFVELPLQ